LRINLQLYAIVGDPLPTDFSLGHVPRLNVTSDR
jgi:hypothetical protein